MKTHWLVDTFAEDSEDEDGRDRRREVAGDGLDVVEELAALGGLHDGDPRYAHPDEDQDKNSAGSPGGCVNTRAVGSMLPKCFTCRRSSAPSHWPFYELLCRCPW